MSEAPATSTASQTRLWWVVGPLIALGALGLLGVVALVGLRLIYEPITHPSNSMAPNLPEGSYSFVYHAAYANDPPRRGDIVVFRLPRDPSAKMVKRLIGLPGDRVQLVGGVVHLNAKPVTQTSIGPEIDGEGIQVMRRHEAYPGGAAFDVYDQSPGHDGDDTNVFIVPPDAYFMLGDNRDNSLDSRWPQEIGVGFVPRANLIGKVVWASKGQVR